MGAEARSRRLSDILDQTADGRAIMASMEQVAAWRKRHRDITGANPSSAARPSDDQLSALHGRMNAGRAPFAEFQLFGPDGDLTTALRRFSARVFVGGEWRTKYVNCPGSFAAWSSSWKVFRAAMIMLGGATPASLGRYSEGGERLVETYGDRARATINSVDIKVRG